MSNPFVASGFIAHPCDLPPADWPRTWVHFTTAPRAGELVTVNGDVYRVAVVTHNVDPPPQKGAPQLVAGRVVATLVPLDAAGGEVIVLVPSAE